MPKRSTKSSRKSDVMEKVREKPMVYKAKSTQLIAIRGARTHNLKGIDLDIRHRSITVITGVSGSGKSSLAFDTLFAEGQRQYIDSMSPYARQFVDTMPRPDVESITGLQPTLCIDQKTTSISPRSTVGTVSEVYDFLRLLMARVATPHCYQCGDPIVQQSPNEIIQQLTSLPEGTKLVIMAPVVRGRKGSHQETLEELSRAGLVRARIDGEMVEIESAPRLNIRKNHTIEAVCDRIVVRPEPDCVDRITKGVQLALKLAKGGLSAAIALPEDVPPSPNQYGFQFPGGSGQPSGQTAGQTGGQTEGQTVGWSESRIFSTKYACARCGISYAEIEPRIFSFNSPHGACPTCDGLGVFTTHWSPGGKSTSKSKSSSKSKSRSESDDDEGLASEPFRDVPCPECLGARLRPESLAVKLAGWSIADLTHMSLEDLAKSLGQLELSGLSSEIAKPILTEMRSRIEFLVQVGVGYLTLDRSARSLSGGELQRVRLATSLGSGLIGVCYVLDEPSIGLHPRDSQKLIQTIEELRDCGNTVVIVEHDEEMMRAADLLVDIGPGAGKEGGRVITLGTPDQVAMHPQSLTGAYLRNSMSVPTSVKRTVGPSDPAIVLRGAHLHNLKKIDVRIPLGTLIGVTGVSGSGKSSLVTQTLVPAIQDWLRARDQKPKGETIESALKIFGPFKSISGLEEIDKLIVIDQKPLGRSIRSTPATYCGVWDEIRKAFAQTRDAKQRGFPSNRFSFNAGAGRCETCQGNGRQKIEMDFLADIYVTCPQCNGRRFNRQTLSVRYRDKNVADVLQMSVREAADFFENFVKIRTILEALVAVGVGYLSLGQPSQTLSGGEAQRVKLASELARPSTGKTLYVLDEPTTGLHIDDVGRLVRVLHGLVEKGNTVMVIEHHMDLAQACDWIIDLGPRGGKDGGELVVAGTPEEVAASQLGWTSKFLQLAIDREGVGIST